MQNPTLSIIAPMQAKLLNDTQETMGDKPVVRDIKQAIRDIALLKKKTPSTQHRPWIHDLSHCLS